MASHARVLVLVAVVALAGCAREVVVVAVPEPPIFCYKSLADPVCYTDPLARDRERLLGFYGPPPPPLPPTGTSYPVVAPPPPPIPHAPLDEHAARFSR